MIWLSYRRLSTCNDDDMRVIKMRRLVCKCCCLAVFYPMVVRRRGVRRCCCRRVGFSLPEVSIPRYNIDYLLPQASTSFY